MVFWAFSLDWLVVHYQVILGDVTGVVVKLVSCTLSSGFLGGIIGTFPIFVCCTLLTAFKWHSKCCRFIGESNTIR